MIVNKTMEITFTEDDTDYLGDWPDIHPGHGGDIHPDRVLVELGDWWPQGKASGDRGPMRAAHLTVTGRRIKRDGTIGEAVHQNGWAVHVLADGHGPDWLRVVVSRAEHVANACQECGAAPGRACEVSCIADMAGC